MHLALVLGFVTPAKAWDVETRLRASSTLTDSRRLSDRNGGELYFNVAPAIRVLNHARRLQVDAMYEPTLTLYAVDRENSRSFNTLRATADWELIPSRLFLESDAGLRQTYLTPFGATAADIGSNPDNQVEDRTLSVSPHLLGELSKGTRYDARFRVASRSTDSDTVSDSVTQSASGFVEHEPDRLGWRVGYEWTDTNYTGRSDIQSDRVTAGLSYRPDRGLTVRARGGYETNSFTQSDQSTVNYGAEFDWLVTPLTRLQASWDHRYFGSAYEVSLSHRHKRSYVGLKAYQRAQNYAQTAQRTQVSDPTRIQEVLDRMFLYAVADDQQRTNLVADLLGRGLSTSELLELLNNQTVKVKGLEASAGLTSARNTIVVKIYSQDTNTIAETDSGEVLTIGSSLNSNNRRVGESISFVRNFSASDTGTVSLSQTDTRSRIPGVDARSKQKNLTVSATRSLSARIQVTVGVRYGKLDSDVTPGYVEHAIFGAFTQDF